MHDQAQPNAHIRAEEMLAAMQPSSLADLAELRQVGSNLDRLLVVEQVELDELVEEFEQARKGTDKRSG